MPRPPRFITQFCEIFCDDLLPRLIGVIRYPLVPVGKVDCSPSKIDLPARLHIGWNIAPFFGCPEMMRSASAAVIATIFSGVAASGVTGNNLIIAPCALNDNVRSGVLR